MPKGPKGQERPADVIKNARPGDEDSHRRGWGRDPLSTRAAPRVPSPQR